MTTSSTRAVRDLLFLDGTGSLVVACDSIGGIGPRPGDAHPASATTVAHFAMRVPLLELLCAGATPIALVNTLCQDRESAGELIDEFRRLAAEVGIPAEAVTGTTEDNVPTTSTGVGVVVIGRRSGSPTIPRALPGDAVICAGLPMSAPRHHIYPGHPDLIAASEVQTLMASGLVHDALPVGSRGLAFEVPELADSAGLVVEWAPDHGLDLSQSGGPSSCVLFACARDDVSRLAALVPPRLPWHVVAHLATR